MAGMTIPTTAAPSQSQQLRWQANWVRAVVRKRTRLHPLEADILLSVLGNAFERVDLSPEAGQRLASLLDELSAQASIQAPDGAVRNIARRAFG